MKSHACALALFKVSVAPLSYHCHTIVAKVCTGHID